MDRRPIPDERSILIACRGGLTTRTRLHRRVLKRIPLFVMLLGVPTLYAACDGPNGPKDVIAAITVTSPIGDVMAVGWTITLVAVATDIRGDTVVRQVAYSWQSSNEAVATVDQNRTVTSVAPGTATITASADGVSGNLPMRVVAADLDRIGRLVNDPFTVLLASGLNTASEVNAGLDTTRQAVTDGNVLAVQRGLEVALSAIDSVTDPDDRALSAVLRLVLDYAKGLLGL